MKYFFEKLRLWDIKSSDRVDLFIANSHFVSERIRKFFGRDSRVIYPPVDVEMKVAEGPRSDTYITVSRLVTYKNVDLIIEAFRQMPDLKLELAGIGPLKKRLLKNLPSNVTYLGYISEEEKIRKISRAKAFIAAATEDFGISIVEAQSYCTPVIIPNIGGYRETVNEKTGVFFCRKTVEDLVMTVRNFEKEKRVFSIDDFRENIKPFSIERFRTEFKAYVDEKIEQHRNRTH
jgi:glycosyltransferase involved in cell wall biosynthesis